MKSTNTRTCSRRLKRKVEKAQEGFHRLSTNHLCRSALRPARRTTSRHLTLDTVTRHRLLRHRLATSDGHGCTSEPRWKTGFSVFGYSDHRRSHLLPCLLSTLLSYFVKICLLTIHL
ncbi:hypothetical protein Hanom_Chr11g01028861 [Helianthus anomalus]